VRPPTDEVNLAEGGAEEGARSDGEEGRRGGPQGWGGDRLGGYVRTDSNDRGPRSGLEVDPATWRTMVIVVTLTAAYFIARSGRPRGELLRFFESQCNWPDATSAAATLSLRRKRSRIFYSHACGSIFSPPSKFLSR
jgi:hypothetical protein